MFNINCLYIELYKVIRTDLQKILLKNRVDKLFFFVFFIPLKSFELDIKIGLQ